MSNADPLSLSHLPDQLSARAVLKQTQHAGRSLYASTNLEKDDILLKVDRPFASVILDEYRKECCVVCFHYDGNKLKTRNKHPDGTKGAKTILYFCSASCQSAWLEEHDADAIEAVAAVEDVIESFKKGKGHSRNGIAKIPGAATLKEISLAWSNAEILINQIVSQRESKNRLTPKLLKAIPQLQPDDDMDTLRFFLDAVLSRALDAAESKGQCWALLENLARSNAPYTSPINGLELLQSHVRLALRLALLLPVTYAPYLTAHTFQTLITRDAGNSFGIWCQEGEADRNYMLGYAIYPASSFFNHSCTPNISKTRSGRSWIFKTMDAIQAQDELCITYLGGDERNPFDDRQKRLKNGWGFKCACDRCNADAGQSEPE